MDKGQALCDLHGIVQLPTPLTALDQTNVLQGVKDEDNVVREPQDKEDSHQSKDKEQCSPRARHPRRGEDTHAAGIAEHHEEERQKETQDVLSDLKDNFPKEVFLAVIMRAHDGFVVHFLRAAEEGIGNGEEYGEDPQHQQDEEGLLPCHRAVRRVGMNYLQIRVQTHAAYKKDTAVEIHDVHGI